MNIDAPWMKKDEKEDKAEDEEKENDSLLTSKWIVCLPPIAKSSKDITHSENQERKMG